jgi:hypothetical protein
MGGIGAAAGAAEFEAGADAAAAALGSGIRSCIVLRQLPSEQVAVQVALARDGAFAVLGCAAGSVVVLNGETLQEIVSLRHTKHDIHR